MKQPVLVTGGTGFLGEHLCASSSTRGAQRARAGARRVARRSRSSASSSCAATWPRSRRRPRRWRGARRRADACSTSPAWSRAIPTTAQRMMRVHVDGTRRVLEAAQGGRRAPRGPRVDVGHHRRVAASRADPRRDARPTPTEIVARLAVLPLEDLPGEAGARARRARSGSRSSSSTRRCCSAPAIAALSSTGDVRAFLKRADPGRARRRRQLRRRARRRRGDRRRARARPRRRALPARRTQLDLRGILRRASSARRKVRAPRLKLPRRAAATRRRDARRAALHGARQGAAGRAHLRRDGAASTGGATRRKAERELGFAARDPGETLDDTDPRSAHAR